jgi:hypothetical protein
VYVLGLHDRLQLPLEFRRVFEGQRHGERASAISMKSAYSINSRGTLQLASGFCDSICPDFEVGDMVKSEISGVRDGCIDGARRRSMARAFLDGNPTE